MTFGRHRLVDWPLDPAVTYLNHGTVGVTPLRVLAAQQAIRDRDRTPAVAGAAAGGLEFRRHRGRAAVTAAGGGGPGRRLCRRGRRDLVFVDNATTGVNAVLRSFPLAAGDEILITDHNYGAIARAATFVARERQARLVTVPRAVPGLRSPGVRGGGRRRHHARERASRCSTTSPPRAR